MTSDNAIIVKEELINVAVLTKLITNYCTSQEAAVQALPIESLIIEINIIKPDVIFVDVKPLIMEEVIMAVSKVIKKIELKNFINIQNSGKFIIPDTKYREYVAISSLKQIEFIKMDDIMFCMADGKYTKFFLVNGDTFLSSKHLGDYEHRILDIDHFFRIHNSYIVNMRFVARINKKGGSSCELKNGFSIPISKRRQENFNKFIQLK